MYSKQGFRSCSSETVRTSASRARCAISAKVVVEAVVAEALILDESVMLEIPLPDCDKQVIQAKVARAMGQSTDSSSRR
jgi:hypothetical protein